MSCDTTRSGWQCLVSGHSWQLSRDIVDTSLRRRSAISKVQLVITAVLKGRRKSDVARDYDVSRYWVQHLFKRYGSEGPGAFEPHSRRPHRIPRGRHRTSQALRPTRWTAWWPALPKMCPRGVILRANSSSDLHNTCGAAGNRTRVI